MPTSPSPFRTAEERERDRTVKRDALLVAAVRMFNERGFHATSLDDVAASLGVTKPVIYHYLGNKDQVLFACVRTGLEQIRDAADKARGEAGNGLSRLKWFLQRYAEVAMGDFGRCTVRTGEEALSPESRAQMTELQTGIHRTIRNFIEQGIADGSIGRVDPRMAAFALAGALNGPGRWFDPDGPMSAREVADGLVEFLLKGLEKR